VTAKNLSGLLIAVQALGGARERWALLTRSAKSGQVSGAGATVCASIGA
jgi:hypothetical protein